MKTAAPIDPFGYQADNELAADLGPVITTRRHSIFEKFVMCLLLGTFAAIAAGGVVGSIGVAVTGGPLMAGLLGSVFCGAILAACVYGIRQTFRVAAFHERGLLERCFGTRRVFRYQELESLTYSATRHYFKGLYAGTAVDLKVRADDGRQFKHHGRHKERARGLGLGMLSLGRTLEGSFKGEDELDVVRDVIAAHISRRLAARLQDAAVSWNGKVAISSGGVIPRRGRYKNSLVAWSRITRMGARDGLFQLFVQGEKKPFATIPTGGTNFYACLSLAHALRNAATAPTELETVAA